ncbi:hypothetical protein RRG08_050072 [Elysia crispata]|uniref:Uncharacterized protein n=1 Tax=Elysia crispata TaxID=231223 RepID=A0AAE1E0D3_9GAST|nr:hypothetical protein RRG08_050072 [Elysia crispata]
MLRLFDGWATNFIKRDPPCNLTLSQQTGTSRLYCSGFKPQAHRILALQLPHLVSPYISDGILALQLPHLVSPYISIGWDTCSSIAASSVPLYLYSMGYLLYSCRI